MPLFMDRHEVPGATAKDAAEAHAADVGLSAEYDVHMLSYWFDAESETAFCFARASEQENLISLHRDAHGLIPNEIIPVSEDSVLQFLGKVHDPVDETEVESAFRTILFTDLEGSTSMTEELGVAAFMPLLKEHDLIVRRAIVSERGREVKHTGDGILASFDEVASALRCSLAIQRGFKTREAEEETQELRVRVGVAAGEPVDHNDDIYGSAVNLASRLCDAAEAETILVSELVHELGSKEGFSFDEVDERSLKGFADPLSVFELSQERGEP
jgi:class 3 adenylate cyclase